MPDLSPGDCKKNLKQGGFLVANNSHGDSSIASVNKDYRLIAVINRNEQRFSVSEKDLDSYFKKKDGTPVDVEKVVKKMTGEGFIKTAFAYIFEYNR